MSAGMGVFERSISVAARAMDTTACLKGREQKAAKGRGMSVESKLPSKGEEMARYLQFEVVFMGCKDEHLNELRHET